MESEEMVRNVIYAAFEELTDLEKAIYRFLEGPDPYVMHGGRRKRGEPVIWGGCLRAKGADEHQGWSMLRPLSRGDILSMVRDPVLTADKEVLGAAKEIRRHRPQVIDKALRRLLTMQFLEFGPRTSVNGRPARTYMIIPLHARPRPDRYVRDGVLNIVANALDLKEQHPDLSVTEFLNRVWQGRDDVEEERFVNDLIDSVAQQSRRRRGVPNHSTTQGVSRKKRYP
jgi:hypothetical protein